MRRSVVLAGGTVTMMSGSLLFAWFWSCHQSPCFMIVRQRVTHVLRSCLIAWHSMHPGLAQNGARFLSRDSMARGECVLFSCAPMYSCAVPIRACLVGRTKCFGNSAVLCSPISNSDIRVGGYVKFDLGTPMANFYSRTLDRTFSLVHFSMKLRKGRIVSRRAPSP